MAEGGDPETTNPFDPHGDDHDESNDKTPLLHRHPPERLPPPWGGKGHKFPSTTKTSTSGEKETSFIDLPSGKLVSSAEKAKEEIERKIKEIFYKPAISSFLSRIDRYGRVMVRLHRINAKEYELINSGGDLAIDLEKLPKGLREALGKTHVEDNNEKYELQEKEEEKQRKREEILEKVKRDKAVNSQDLQDAESRLENLNRVLREQIGAKNNAESSEEVEDIDRSIARTRKSIKTVGIEVDDHTKERNRLEQARREAGEQVVEGERIVETARERVNERLLSLRDRIKEIFKKHGFTAFAVATAIGTVIGVIVSSLKAGLTNVAKGVGNGLKELGKKLGEILPGMIGAIASFIFRTAGEVIGFLAKNAWLLIVGLVVLAVEQFKKKSK